MMSKTEQEEQRKLRRGKVTKALIWLGRNIIKAIKGFWMALKLLATELKYRIGGPQPA
jgi:hypothetical protein